MVGSGYGARSMTERDREQRREEMRRAKQQRQRKERLLMVVLAAVGLAGIVWIGTRPAIDTPVEPEDAAPAVAPAEPGPQDPEDDE